MNRLDYFDGTNQSRAGGGDKAGVNYGISVLRACPTCPHSVVLLGISLLLISLGAAAELPLMPMPVKVEAGTGWLTATGAPVVACTDSRVALMVGRAANGLAMSVTCQTSGAVNPILGEDESYVLDVAASGASIRAATGTGALRGLATFAQLVHAGRAPVVHIEDRPRFLWRGLMLDASRHWMPVEVVKRNLDAMAAVKLNVFHWHLSDDQGFRVESKRFPKFQERASDGKFYTQDQIRDVVQYARDRAIRVVPEFDMPGHTQSWLAAYPELATVPETYQIARSWGGFEPVIDPTREEVYQFLDVFIGEMAGLFPDAYFHIGGDEVNPKQWNQSAAVQAFMKDHYIENVRALQAYFNQRIEAILEKYGKKTIGWDEILHPDLPPSIVIQSWRGQQALADAASQGRKGILSWGYYLDHLSPASYHYGIDPVSPKLTAEQAANVLGGEACMWAEFVDAETVDSRIWPRAAAIAERLWAAREVTDVDSMYARLEAVSRSLESTGVQHRASYETMLDRLAGVDMPEALRVLAEASEALGLGPRAKARTYISSDPLNRFVDSIPAESERVRALELAARSYKAADRALLKKQFATWVANDARFEKLAAGNAMLAELKPLSRNLATVGRIGLRALDGKRPTTAWIKEQNRVLAQILKPTAEVRLAGARVVKGLLENIGHR